jgi:uncharacterized protein
METGTAFDLVASWGIGFVGSLHCLGMCGPIILAYSIYLGSPSISITTPPGALMFHSGIFHHLAFHLGRLMTYGFLGALAGLLFHFANQDRLFLHIRSSLTLAGGILMIFMGFALLRIIPLPGLTIFFSGSSNITASLGRLFGSQSVYSKMALGMAVGFLPCGLSWAMVVKAATTHNILAGFLVMVAFGLGTVPALLLPGISASILSLKLRIVGERLAATSIIVMGLILVFKGVKVFV